MPRTSDAALPLPRIIVDDVHKDFTLRRTHSIKETAVAALRRKPLTDDFHALDGISFEIGEGESVAILGFNGSGKSTTLKLISGVLRPDAGRILTRGRVAGLIEVGAGFHPDLSGRENIYLNAAILGMSKKETDARFDDIVAFSEIEQFIDTEVKHYSSGMFLRLAFSVAIHTEVDILLIDEILSVGDEPFQRKCLARIRQLNAEGKTLVVVSHDLDMVERLCNRGVVLKDGKVVYDGPSDAAVMRLRTLSNSPFADVGRDHPFFDAMVEMAEEMILPPSSDATGRGLFHPEDLVTRGQLALALHRLSRGRTTIDWPGGESANAPGVSETEAFAQLNEILGDSGSSDAALAATRSDVARAFHGLVGRPAPGAPARFADVAADAENAASIAWMYGAGISRGWEEPDGSYTYRPSAPMTREVLAAMLARFRKHVALPEPGTSSTQPS